MRSLTTAIVRQSSGDCRRKPDLAVVSAEPRRDSSFGESILSRARSGYFATCSHGLEWGGRKPQRSAMLNMCDMRERQRFAAMGVADLEAWNFATSAEVISVISRRPNAGRIWRNRLRRSSAAERGFLLTRTCSDK